MKRGRERHVFETVRQDIPPLRQAVKRILDEMGAAE